MYPVRVTCLSKNDRLSVTSSKLILPSGGMVAVVRAKRAGSGVRANAGQVRAVGL